MLKEIDEFVRMNAQNSKKTELKEDKIALGFTFENGERENRSMSNLDNLKKTLKRLLEQEKKEMKDINLVVPMLFKVIPDKRDLCHEVVQALDAKCAEIHEVYTEAIRRYVVSAIASEFQSDTLDADSKELVHNIIKKRASKIPDRELREEIAYVYNKLYKAVESEVQTVLTRKQGGLEQRMIEYLTASGYKVKKANIEKSTKAPSEQPEKMTDASIPVDDLLSLFFF